MQGVIAPAIAQVKSLHDGIDERSSVGPAIVLFVTKERSRGGAVLFKVINVVTEALKADQIMRRLPDHTGNGYLAHHAQQNDLLFLSHAHLFQSATPTT